MNLKDVQFFFHTAIKSPLESLPSSNIWAEFLKVLSQITTIYDLRNFVSNVKKHVSKTDQIDCEDPYLFEMMNALLLEVLYGSMAEIKGSLTVLISVMTASSEGLKSKFSKVYLGLALENFIRECEKTHNNSELDFDKETRCLKIFSHIFELYEDFSCEFDTIIIKKLLVYHLDFLGQMEKILMVKKLYLLKHLDLLAEEMRNIYAIFMNFQRKDFFKFEHHEEEFVKLQEKLNNFYAFTNFISKDVLCQLAVLTVFFELRIKKDYFFKEILNIFLIIRKL